MHSSLGRQISGDERGETGFSACGGAVQIRPDKAWLVRGSNKAAALSFLYFSCLVFL